MQGGKRARYICEKCKSAAQQSLCAEHYPEAQKRARPSAYTICDELCIFFEHDKNDVNALTRLQPRLGRQGRFIVVDITYAGNVHHMSRETINSAW